MPTDALSAVIAYLQSRCMHVPMQWIKDCVAYYKSQDPNISIPKLFEEVTQQWLLVNLRELKMPSFPPNLSQIKETTLSGKYAVQIETTIDCSKSLYSQFQAIRKVSLENIETTAKPSEEKNEGKRCLLMTVTDGVQELKAMEYKPIPNLKLNDPDQPPGLKILIIGPVICRKGMLMLTSQNVEILGGEVDDIIQSNRYACLLARGLNIPYVEEKSDTPVFEEDDDQFFLNIPEEPINVAENAPQSTVETRPFSRESHNSQITENNTLHNYMEDFDSTNTQTNFTEEDINNQSDHLFKNVDSVATMDNFDLYEESEIIDNDEELLAEAPLAIQPVEPIKINPQPFVYLSELAKLSITFDRDFHIKAIVLDVLEKMKVHEDSFVLKAKISDGSLSVVVTFCSELLEGILGFSPKEYVGMVNSKVKNPAMAIMIKSGFGKLKNKLIELNCIMKIRLYADRSKLPCIMEWVEVDIRHLNQLKARNVK